MSDDTISRQAAIDAIYALSDDTIAWLDAAAEAVKELPSAKQWIPVSEMLPEEGEQVLVCDYGGFIYTAEYEVSYDGEPRWYESVEYRPMDDVVAWMPLPDPWKGEEDG